MGDHNSNSKERRTKPTRLFAWLSVVCAVPAWAFIYLDLFFGNLHSYNIFPGCFCLLCIPLGIIFGIVSLLKNKQDFSVGLAYTGITINIMAGVTMVLFIGC